MSNEKKIIKAAKGTDEFLDSSIRHHRRRLLDSIKTLENNIIDTVFVGIYLGVQILGQHGDQGYNRVCGITGGSYA